MNVKFFFLNICEYKGPHLHENAEKKYLYYVQNNGLLGRYTLKVLPK